MASTSPDGLRTPAPGDPFAPVADLAILANDVQEALNTRGNLYVGTSSERISFGSAPDGTHWQDTNGGKLEYVRDSGQWVPIRGVSPEINLTSDLLAGYRGTATGQTVDSFKRLVVRANGSQNIAVGENLIGTLRPEWRPADQIQVPVRLSGGYPAICLLNVSGVMQIYNHSGAARGAAWFEVNYI